MIKNFEIFLPKTYHDSWVKIDGKKLNGVQEVFIIRKTKGLPKIILKMIASKIIIHGEGEIKEK